MKRISTYFFLTILLLIAFQGHGLAQITILHEFTGVASDGRSPTGSLVSDGVALYGMTVGGGDGFGVIFKIYPDGTGFELLHEFLLGAGDGRGPSGSLILDESTLYGMTSGGGFGGYGVIFKINTDGSGYELLHEFAGGADGGSFPCGSLTHDGASLYGMTSQGGASDLGVVFRINVDGSGYALLHEFAGGADDGSTPYGSLFSDGSALYGMTTTGGDSNRGVIFKINPDGSGFKLLHEFADFPNDGSNPIGSFISNGSTLYGMTAHGGGGFSGVIFKINTNGLGYELLYEFAGAPDDGSGPSGTPILDRATLYGMTRGGGFFSEGVIFSFDLVTPQPIPTLGEWGIIMLAVLLALAALAVIKRGALKFGRTA